MFLGSILFYCELPSGGECGLGLVNGSIAYQKKTMFVPKEMKVYAPKKPDGVLVYHHSLDWVAEKYFYNCLHLPLLTSLSSKVRNMDGCKTSLNPQP